MSSLGNHEFDEGVSGLSPFIKALNSPVLAANLILDKEPDLQNEENLYNSTVFTINGVKIGVIGYLTPDTKFLADRTNVEYIDEVIALKREVRVLKDQGVNILIALGHSGYIKDIEIAREVEDIDLVIGGHSNTFLWNGSSPDNEIPQGPYPKMIKQTSGRLVPVVQAYAYTKYLGKLLLTFDSRGEITKYHGSPILLDQSVPQDPEVFKLISRYSEDMARITDEVLGNSSVLLDGASCRLRECNIGTFITDAVIDYYAEHYKGDHWTDAPIAILQGGRIRSSINHPARPIPLTRGDWITVLPFSGYLVVVTMNGSVLMQALEHTVISWRLVDSPGQFLQLSGIEIIYDFTKPPGARVVSAKARCSKCKVPDFFDIKKDEEYKVIMPNFLSTGGDGFTMFDNLPTEQLAYDEISCVTHYLSKNSPIAPNITGRIKILNEEKLSNTNSASTLKVYFLSVLILTYAVL